MSSAIRWPDWSAASASRKPAAAPSVLVIEDDRTIGRFVQFVLMDEGYRVTWCEGGLEGLATARTLRPQVILLDLMLPDVRGEQILHRLRADDGTRDIPVIIMSAVADRLQPQDLRLTWGVIKKPFDLEELLTAVARASGGAPE